MEIEFVAVTCPKGNQRPYMVHGHARPYLRVGSTCREATNDEIRRLYLEDGNLSHESVAVPGATLDDISPERVAWYVARRVRGGSMPPGPLPELLGKLGVLKMIDEADKFVTRNTRHGIRIEGFKHVNVHEYPIEAIREAITNALCHRDWGMIGSQVRVAVFDDRIFVDSPGRLPPGVTLENIETVHVLRNPVIAQLLYDIEYIENWGSGVPRMKRAMRAYNLPAPAFAEPGPNFTVTFSGPGDRFMRELAARPEWMIGLNDRQIKAVLYVGEKGQITVNEYRLMVNVSAITVRRDLRDLCKRGIFSARGRSVSTHYVLAQ